jgi:hypothetical protein
LLGCPDSRNHPDDRASEVMSPLSPWWAYVRGERAFDIYSRPLNERIVFQTPVDQMPT